MSTQQNQLVTPRSTAVLKAITAVTAALSKYGIVKDKQNEQQHYRFRGIDDVYNALSSLLAEHRLMILPSVQSRTCEARETAKGGILYNVVLQVELHFISSEDGSREIVTTYGEAMDSGDKATNKAMSAAYKYACIQTFCIPTEPENDADFTTPPDSRPTGSKAQAQAVAAQKITQLQAPQPRPVETRELPIPGLAETDALVKQQLWDRMKTMTGCMDVLGELKARCIKEGLSESVYYEALAQQGVSHKNEFRGQLNKARLAAAELAMLLNKIRQAPDELEGEEYR